MTVCQSRIDGACGRKATWKQEVRVGDRPSGRVLDCSHWSDEHAARITNRREVEFAPPRC